MAGSNIALELKRRGYKLTTQRKAIIKVLNSSGEHLTPADIFTRLQAVHPEVGLVTVYRTLELLQESGLICEVHTGDNCRSYLKSREGEHHHHLVCSSCGKVIDFTGCELEDLQKRLSVETGFRIDKHVLEFVGRCRRCLSREESI